MTRIYVTDPAARVAVRGGKVVVSREGEVQGQWPLEQVQGVMCFGPVSMTGYAMDALLEQQIPVHRFSMGGRYRGSLSAGDPRELFLRMAQHDRWRDEAFRMGMARALVQTKVRHQRELVERALRRRVAPAAEELTRSLAGLLELEGRAGGAEDIPTLMGYEGAASAAYFGAYGALFRRGVSFTGRNRRPPRDPVNALLSLGYTLVGAELSGLLGAAGLDPYLGFLHGFRYGRESLAQDLLEELRGP